MSDCGDEDNIRRAHTAVRSFSVEEMFLMLSHIWTPQMNLKRLRHKLSPMQNMQDMAAMTGDER